MKPEDPTASIDMAMMELALAEAERGRGRTSPNPLVGAVVVDDRGGRPGVLATGYHARLGHDHAEVAALRKLGGQALGKTLYVTLEPCNHVGRTGNCTEALLQAGVRRVVVGMRDPNPNVPGGGVERLRAQGVQVEVGLLEAACRRQNRGYLHWLRTGWPHLILKAAVSLDGRLAPQQAGAYWLTGPQAVQRAHEMRDACDGILVGAGTVIKDDPQLTVRLPPERQRDQRQPLRIVLDGRLLVPETARVNGPGTLLVTTEAAVQTRPERQQSLVARGVEVVALPEARVGSGQVDLRALLSLLGQRELLMVMCEGGSTLHGALLSDNLYDEAAIFIAPVLLGDGAVPLAQGFAVPAFADARWLSEVSVEPLGRDVLVTGLLSGGGGTCSPD